MDECTLRKGVVLIVAERCESEERCVKGVVQDVGWN